MVAQHTKLIHFIFATMTFMPSYQAMGRQKGVCKADFSRLCPGQSWSTGNMLACFKKHPGELSATCATYTSRVRGGLIRFDSFQDACQKDYGYLCGTNVFTVNRAKSCLRNNRARVSAPCGTSFDAFFAYLKTGNPAYIPEAEDSYQLYASERSNFNGRSSRRANDQESLAALSRDADQDRLLKKGKDRKGDLQKNALSRLMDSMSEKASGLLGMSKADRTGGQNSAQ